MTATESDDLNRTVAQMRRLGITQLRLNGMEVALGPEALADAAAPKPEAVTEIGVTGMTREEQVELFGQVFEVDFRKEAH